MTKQAKHTPGPWRALNSGMAEKKGPFDLTVCDDDGNWIAQSCFEDTGIEIAKANTRLIAAAPEMAEELLGCLDMLEATNGSGPVPIPPRWAKLGPKGTFSHIRAVLEKAGVLDGGI